MRSIAGLSLAYRLGAIAAPAITTLAAARRLPDLSAGNVLVDDSAGARIERFSLRSLRFFCLPDDPAVEHPDAKRAIADVEELLAAEPRTRRSALAFYIGDRGAGAIVRHWRGVCCLTYRLAGNGMCEGECPLPPGGRLAPEGAASASRAALARDA